MEAKEKQTGSSLGENSSKLDDSQMCYRGNKQARTPKVEQSGQGPGGGDEWQ